MTGIRTGFSWRDVSTNNALTGASTYLELVETSFHKILPVAQEVLAWSDTETDDGKRVCNIPISGLTCHIPRSGVYRLYRFRPYWMIDFRLSSLQQYR